MKIWTRYLPAAVVCLLMQLSAFSVTAETITRSTTGIFNYQQGLAESNDEQAQFKLGMFYELGVGTKTDVDLAREWYQKASKAGSADAKNRLVYLDIRHKGYRVKKHAAWINGIRKEADEGNTYSTMLLGQLYSYGTGVKKDLDRSIQLLDKVDVFACPVVTYELNRVQDERNALTSLESKRKIQSAEQKRTPKKLLVKVVSTDGQKNSVEVTAERKRYNELMRKFSYDVRSLTADDSSFDSFYASK